MRPHVPPDFFAVINAIQPHKQIHEIFVGAPRFELFRHAGSREPPEYRRSKRLQPRVSPHPERGARRERQQVRQEIAHTVHQIDGGLLIRHRHVHMHPEDQQRPRQLSHFFDDVLVAFTRRNHLVDPARKGMCARGCHLQPRALRRRYQFAARPVHFDAQFADVIADARPGLHNGLVKFVFHLFRNVRRNLGDDLADVRTKLARCRIYDLKFFLDADGKAVSHGRALWTLRRAGEFNPRIIPCQPANLHLLEAPERCRKLDGVKLALDATPARLPDSFACKSSLFESNSISASTNSPPGICSPVPTPSPAPSRNSSTSSREPTSASSNTGAATPNLPVLPGCAKPSPPSTNKSSPTTSSFWPPPKKAFSCSTTPSSDQAIM